MRKSEIQNLKWSEVSLVGRTITLPSSRTKNKRPHIVPLNNSAYEILKGLKERRLNSLNGYVFFDVETGKPGRGGIRYAWLSLCKKAKLENFHFHDLRHDYATRLIANGVDIYEVSRRLGHFSVTVTERYAHLISTVEHLKKVVGGVE